jgi:hypothetical protein
VGTVDLGGPIVQIAGGGSGTGQPSLYALRNDSVLFEDTASGVTAIASLPNQDDSNYLGWRYSVSLVLQFPTGSTNINLGLNGNFGVTANSSTTALSQGRQVVSTFEQSLAWAGFAFSQVGFGDSAVNYTPAAKFVVGAPTSVYAGAQFNVTVTAEDSNSNPTRGFNGTVTLTGSGAPVPIQVSNGQGSGTLTINQQGTFSITASAGSIRGTSGPVSVTYYEYQYTYIVYAMAYGDPYDYVVASTTIQFVAQPSLAGIVLSNLEAAWDSHLDVSYDYITSTLDGSPIGQLV